ncbi:MAG: NYN domain-containing protein, partial [Pseudomonadota bacterium]
RRVRGNMDVELAIDMLETSAHVDHIVIFSGNGDFRRAVEAVKAKGVRVTVISTVKSQPQMIGDDLRREADVFIDLDEMSDLVARPRRDNDDRGPGHYDN